MAFCSSCGVQNEDGSMFCSNCGNRFESSSEQPAKHIPNYEDQSNSSPPPQQPQYYDGNQNYPQPQHNQQQYSGSYQPPTAYGQPYGMVPIEDRLSIILYIVSFLFFPIGIIVFFANRRSRPNSAKNIAITTVLGFILLWAL